MVKIKNASKKIKGKMILENITFQTEPGKMYGIEGPNGSGKTMFLRLCCDLIRPSSGEVVIDKETTFGVLIETPGFMFQETAYANLKYLADIRKKIGKPEINEILEKVGLVDSSNIKVKKFSLGMLQKLGIAQAIMENPDVLLLDEPFNALDETSCETVKQLLLEQKKRGASIVVVSHALDYVREYCDSTYKITNGHLQLSDAK